MAYIQNSYKDNNKQYCTIKNKKKLVYSGFRTTMPDNIVQNITNYDTHSTQNLFKINTFNKKR